MTTVERLGQSTTVSQRFGRGSWKVLGGRGQRQHPTLIIGVTEFAASTACGATAMQRTLIRPASRVRVM
jgi:hypothetical protein